jgi:YHS domain-containing protein
MPETHIDHVCSMEVDAEEAIALRLTSEYKGRNYFFCADSCKQSFDANPEKYVGKK